MLLTIFLKLRVMNCNVCVVGDHGDEDGYSDDGSACQRCLLMINCAGGGGDAFADFIYLFH